MLGASTIGLATPFALGYALHAGRGAAASLPGRAALALASIEALAALVIAGGRILSRLA